MAYGCLNLQIGGVRDDAWISWFLLVVMEFRNVIDWRVSLGLLICGLWLDDEVDGKFIQIIAQVFVHGFFGRTGWRFSKSSFTTCPGSRICCSLNYFETNLRLLNSFDSDMLFGCLIHYEDYEMDEFDSMFSFQLIMYVSLNINVWHRPDE